MDYFLLMLARFIAVIVIVIFHEWAHAFAAYRCGDSTAKDAGRMTLNPAKHFDPLGIAAFVFVGFGWANPVPINPNNFNNRQSGALWTASAGVLANYIMAFIFYPLLALYIAYVLPALNGVYAGYFLLWLLQFLFSYSLSFCAFNLIPLYPLDGFRIIEATDTKRGKAYWFMRQYGYYILLGLMVISMLASYIPVFAYIDILSYMRAFAVNILGKPITLFWDWILGLILR